MKGKGRRKRLTQRSHRAQSSQRRERRRGTVTQSSQRKERRGHRGEKCGRGIPPLRGSTRQKAARKKKSGRSGRDDNFGVEAVSREGRKKGPDGDEAGARAQCGGEARRLLELFLQFGELQLGLGERLYNEALGVFGSEVARGGHFADQKVLGALQHFLFSEGQRFAAAEGNEALENNGHFQKRTRAHALGILLETMFPIVMRIQF